MNVALVDDTAFGAVIYLGSDHPGLGWRLCIRWNRCASTKATTRLGKQLGVVSPQAKGHQAEQQQEGFRGSPAAETPLTLDSVH